LCLIFWRALRIDLLRKDSRIGRAVLRGGFSRQIVFEATSALGTVGLSTGATLLLDEIGKLIIMIAMFAGRIGPITLVMFLSDDQATSVSPCPDVKISLT